MGNRGTLKSDAACTIRARYAAHAVAEIRQDFISCDSFCLSNEILREIWRPLPPRLSHLQPPQPGQARVPVNSIVLNRITRAVRLIFPARRLFLIGYFLRPPRIRDPPLPLDAVSSFFSFPRPPPRAPRPGTCRGSYARRYTHFRNYERARPRDANLSFFIPPEFLPRRRYPRRDSVYIFIFYLFLCLDISVRFPRISISLSYVFSFAPLRISI